MKNTDLIITLLDFLIESRSQPQPQEEIKQKPSQVNKVFKSSNKYPQNDALWQELGIDLAEHFGQENLKDIMTSKPNTIMETPIKSVEKVTDKTNSLTQQNKPNLTPDNTIATSEKTPDKVKNQPKAFDDFDFDF